MKNIVYENNRPSSPWRFRRRVNGKVVTRYFKTKREAENFAREFTTKNAELGLKAMFFSAEDKALLGKIREICGDYDPLQAINEWKAGIAKASHSNGPIPPLREAFAMFIEWLDKANRKKRTIDTIRSVGSKFLPQFENTPIPRIDSRALAEWARSKELSKHSPVTIKRHIVVACNFLNWCKSVHGWINEVPKVSDRLLPKADKTPIKIWTVAEAERAMRFIEKEYPHLVPHYALRMFAGLRTSEAEQMRWEWIDCKNKRITVPAEICKTRDNWLILPDFVPDTVWLWLSPFKRQKGAVLSPTKAPRVRIAEHCQWEQNVLRHTFATMHVAYYHDEAKTMLATRHANLATLRNNYRGVNQTKEDAVAFFALRPLSKRA